MRPWVKLLVIVGAVLLFCDDVLAEPIWFRPVYLPLVMGEQTSVLPPVCGDIEAPPETFTNVGEVAYIYGMNGITGKAIVAGLQTLTIWGFDYDGHDTADVRLVLSGNYWTPVAKLKVLDRAYNDECFWLCIPNHLRDGDADRIAIVRAEDQALLGVGVFLTNIQ